MMDKLMGWQWHLMHHMKVICTSFQTDNYLIIQFLYARCSCWCSNSSVEVLKALSNKTNFVKLLSCYYQTNALVKSLNLCIQDPILNSATFVKFLTFNSFYWVFFWFCMVHWAGTICQLLSVLVLHYIISQYKPLFFNFYCEVFSVAVIS